MFEEHNNTNPSNKRKGINQPRVDKYNQIVNPQKQINIPNEPRLSSGVERSMNRSNKQQQRRHERFILRPPKTKTEVPIPEVESKPHTNHTPMSVAVVRSIQGFSNRRLLHILFDSGAQTTMIHERTLAKGATPYIRHGAQSVGIGGRVDSSRIVVIDGLRMPEFSNSRSYQPFYARVFDSESRYDIILGRREMEGMGINVNHKSRKVTWDELEVDFKTDDEFNTKLVASIVETCEELEDAEIYVDSEIRTREYEPVSPQDVAAKQDHMTEAQKRLFAEVLADYSVVFDGKLGRYPHKQITIDLIDHAKPVHKRAYSVPRRHMTVFKDELQHLVKDGVLEQVGCSEWGFPTFIIPKESGTVRWVSDFRELNKLIKRRPYPMPIIGDVMLNRAGYKWFTKIDVSMQFYCFELDDKSSKICTIVTPFGKYRYKRLPMGVKISPDIAQSIMKGIFDDLDVEVYIDDIGFWSTGTFEEHMVVVKELLQRLSDNGLKCNPLKCAWAVKEADFLGYHMTPAGVKPKQKRIEAILRMQRPQNIKQLRSFIGAVNFYKTMFPRRTHVLRPLTRLTGVKKFQWNDEHTKAFEQMKAIIAQDCINNYADINKPFHIYTDSSDYQMGAVLLQYDKGVRRIIAYWSKTLSPAQANYNTLEKELLAIVMC